ncbi:prepilin peptidase [Sphingomonas sp. QA11]|uniref:A24 family peptidase n=1 Tax=Sphingomonas sp. QA11 TaxID=2950605 RepID=UPI00234B2461|nr:prepilin peptidase [Sphingomonas sp. QA11]WCM28296.1 prepilin peptidase [Sphingomonas sp. QA11]
MGGGIQYALLLGALALLLVSAGIQDARTREIANWKNLAILVLAPFWWWANGLSLWPDIAIQLGVAAIVFAFFFGAFAFGWMGGGDVKMIGALALWFPFAGLAWMLIVMSLLGGALTLLLVIERAVRKKTGAIEIPYGVAIAIAALLTLREPILNQFL